jgi:hypothetical protein
MHRNLHMGANAYEEELEHMHGSLRICTGASAYIYIPYTRPMPIRVRGDVGPIKRIRIKHFGGHNGN